MRALSLVILALAGTALAACGEAEKAEAPVRPVRTIVVTREAVAELRSATGEIRPRYEAAIGFRVSGKIIERTANLGDRVKQGDLLARIDDALAKGTVATAEANLAAAKASLSQTSRDAGRQRQLLQKGFTTQAKVDQLLSSLETAEANQRAAEVNLANAKDQLAYTELRADSDAVVTEVAGEAGQVVQAGQMVLRLARPEEREAVFHVSEQAIAGIKDGTEIEVALAGHADVSTLGTVREVAPSADSRTRTYEVRIQLPDAPPQMALGATVVGSARATEQTLVTIPASALFHHGEKPAVFVLDLAQSVVTLREVKLARYETDRVLIESGITDGDVIVTAGVNTLQDGQKVRRFEESAS